MVSDTQPTRLYVKGVHLGFKRGLRNQYNHTSLIKIAGVDAKENVEFYLGKKIAFITKAQRAGKDGSKFRVNWGKVTRAHGSNGVVRAKFSSPLPPQSIGANVRVMLYPSRV
jgi:large subunit ribosomal protein L35Ae